MLQLYNYDIGKKNVIIQKNQACLKCRFITIYLGTAIDYICTVPLKVLWLIFGSSLDLELLRG